MFYLLYLGRDSGAAFVYKKSVSWEWKYLGLLHEMGWEGHIWNSPLVLAHFIHQLIRGIPITFLVLLQFPKRALYGPAASFIKLGRMGSLQANARDLLIEVR